ncbi:hypothetical protein E2C01_034063 [Portunus trituberculatus]|uniref:Uncharacterized protein n=1 Tax=Portunus trituberculatus TaxID=210409 RepID=A0A5B7F5Y7_PORTR|nr:hypothetical protein [Portunus trituberculatus]
MTILVHSIPAVTRKSLTVPPSRMVGLVLHVVVLYSAMKSSFTDTKALYDGLLHTIQGTPRVLARAHTPRCWTYTTDPAQESWDAMVTVAQHLIDLRQQERKKYWVSFLDWVCRTWSLWDVWHHINSVWGKPRRQVCDPDPTDRAQELVLQWKEASYFSGTRRHSISKDHKGWS